MALAPLVAYDMRFGMRPHFHPPSKINHWALSGRSDLVHDVSSATLAICAMTNLVSP